jgi:hypothetical protein
MTQPLYRHVAWPGRSQSTVVDRAPLCKLLILARSIFGDFSSFFGKMGG